MTNEEYYKLLLDKGKPKTRDKKIIGIDCYDGRLMITRRIYGMAFDFKHTGIHRLIGEERKFVLEDGRGMRLTEDGKHTIWCSVYNISMN